MFLKLLLFLFVSFSSFILSIKFLHIEYTTHFSSVLQSWTLNNLYSLKNESYILHNKCNNLIDTVNLWKEKKRSSTALFWIILYSTCNNLIDIIKLLKLVKEKEFLLYLSILLLSIPLLHFYCVFYIFTIFLLDSSLKIGSLLCNKQIQNCREALLHCLTLNNFIFYVQQFNTYYKTTETYERRKRRKGH